MEETNAPAASPAPVLVPDWPEDSDGEEESREEEGFHVNLYDDDSGVVERGKDHGDGDKVASSLSWLEQAAPDILALILSHLTLHEILMDVSFASKKILKACRSNALWRLKFVARWNVPWLQQQQLDSWYHAFQQAYTYSHELWITHWNCVWSQDALCPGRCSIPTHYTRQHQQHQPQQPTRTTTATSCDSSHLLCPSCRYSSPTAQPLDPTSTPLFNKTLPKTRAEAVALATQALLDPFKQHTDNDKDKDKDSDNDKHQPSIPKFLYRDHAPPSRSRAARAFAQAATFQRTIDTRQYETHALCFLKDVLFFSQANDQHHQTFSWHVIRISNPDYRRPVVFAAYVQSEDFTIMPSEGYLEPGQTTFAVLGYHRQRDHNTGTTTPTPNNSTFTHPPNTFSKIPTFTATATAATRTDTNNPPTLVPFSIRYRHAPVVPCRLASFSSDYNNNNHQGPFLIEDELTDEGHDLDGAASTIDIQDPTRTWEAVWNHPVPLHQVATILLSAHVNHQYPIWDFWKQTLSCWNIKTSPSSSLSHPPSSFQAATNTTVLYTAPHLMALYPDTWETLQNIELEQQETVRAHNYRTQGPCAGCREKWGVRREELAQAYVLALRFDCQFHSSTRIMNNIVLCLRKLCSMIQQRERDTLQQDSSETTTGEVALAKQRFLLKVVEHKLYMQTATFTTMRQEAVLSQLLRLVKSLEDRLPIPEDTAGGNYPPLLDNNLNTNQIVTRHSWRYLGLGDPSTKDPNHPLQKPVSDIFGDNPLLAVNCAVAMLYNPQSLVGHGVYDRVPFPGTATPKYPSIPVADILCRDIIVSKIKILEDAQESQSAQGLQQQQQQTQTSPLSLVSSKSRLLYYQLQNALNINALRLIDTLQHGGKEQQKWRTENHAVPSSLAFQHFISNVPFPGEGSFPLSDMNHASDGTHNVVPMDLDEDINLAETQEATGNTSAVETASQDGIEGSEHSGPQPPGAGQAAAHQQHPPFRRNNNPPPAMVGGMRGPRVLNLLWVLSAHLGWTVDDQQSQGCVYVDRRVLISSHWFSIALMSVPLLCSLLARHCHWIPTKPMDYYLENLPYEIDNQMRYLSERECGYMALVLIMLWLWLGRWIERYTGRDLYRAIQECVAPRRNKHDKPAYLSSLLLAISLWFHRQWDALCPLFLQRLTFLPHWNSRTPQDVSKNVAFWKSKDLREHRSMFRATEGLGRMIPTNNRSKDLNLVDDSFNRKLFVGLLVMLASFCASSPHFFLNLLTVFSCSISLGLSLSLQSMETGNPGVCWNSSGGSILKPLKLPAVVILSVLVGQLVGSSGGILFLAEFVVTSVSLLLGGAGTISASAMESWGCFFCLSSTAFWGYLFGRVAPLEGLRQKRNGYSTILLCASLVFVCCLWVFAFLVWRWETPAGVMIIHPSYKNNSRNRKYEIGKHLQ